MQPIKVIKVLANFVGNRGVICGGCCRDVYLGRTPKDYDIFLFTREVARDIGKKLGGELYYEGDNGTIYSTLLRGHTIQWIYGGLGNNPADIVTTFPFTVNQFWYDVERGQVVATPLAKEAVRDKTIRYNKWGHVPGLHGKKEIRTFLVLRATYLAQKLGLTITPESIVGIYEKYED